MERFRCFWVVFVWFALKSGLEWAVFAGRELSAGRIALAWLWLAESVSGFCCRDGIRRIIRAQWGK